MPVRVAVAQMECVLGDVAANCAAITRLAEQAAGAGCDAVVYPEMADTGYEMKTIVQKASAWEEGALPQLRETAARLGIWMVCGLSEREGSDVYNAVAILDRSGGLAGRYRKAHLFTLAREPRFLKRGESLTVTAIEGLQWGVMLCYDIRFPEMARSLALRGAEVIAVLAAWPAARGNHWCTLLAGRAIENQLYVIGANRAGSDGSLRFAGASRVVDPYGVVVAAAPEAGQHLLIAEVTGGRVSEVRASMPVFEDRRPDLYRIDQAGVNREPGRARGPSTSSSA